MKNKFYYKIKTYFSFKISFFCKDNARATKSELPLLFFLFCVKY